MSEQRSKHEKLVAKVVKVVVDFSNAEGGLSMADIYWLFGPPDSLHEIPAAIGKLPITKID